MKSVAIVSVNDDTAKTTAKNLAQKLKFKYVDLEEEFDKILVLNYKLSAFETRLLENKERSLIENLSMHENLIFSLTNDMFLSNSNYNLLKNSFRVLVEHSFEDEIQINIQNLIKKHVNIVIKANEIEKLIEFIKG